MNRLVERAHVPFARRGQWGDEFDRMLEGFFQPLRWVEEATSDLVPAIDVIERADEFVIEAELAGVHKDDIDVTLENGVLTITAQVKRVVGEGAGERVIRDERRYGKYVRSLRLGTQVDEKRVRANYRDGVLELTLPKAEVVKPKKINVDVA